MIYYVVQVILWDGTHRYFHPSVNTEEMPLSIQKAFWFVSYGRAEYEASRFEQATVRTIRID